MRTLITLIVLLTTALEVPAGELRGTWFKIVAGKAVVRVFDGTRFYTIFQDRTGRIAYYATGTYKLEKTQVTYTYEGGFPKEVFQTGKVDSEPVEVRLDSLTIGIGDKKMSFARLKEGTQDPVDTGKIHETIHEVSEADGIPKRINAPAIGYPHQFRKEGIEGIVIEEVVIGQDGSIVGARSLGSNHTLFVAEVASAIRKFRYDPPTINGQPACVRMFIPFIFGFEK